MNHVTRRTTAIMVSMVILAGCVFGVSTDANASGVGLSKKAITLTEGNTTTIYLKNGNKKAKTTWQASNSSVKFIKKGTSGNQAFVTIKAMKKGNVVVTARYKIGKEKVRVLRLKITVNGKISEVTPKPTIRPTVKPTAIPTVQPTAIPTVKPTIIPTVKPTAIPTVQPTPDSAGFTIPPSDYQKYYANNTYGTYITTEYDSNMTNSKRPVNIILPAGYSANKKYPVVYVCHGIGCNQDSFGVGQNNEFYKISGNLYSTAANCEEMIIVIPNIRVSSTPESNIFSLQNFKYYDDFREELINNLMPYMEKTYSIKTGRENTAITGFSMGGREALYIGMTRPEYFGYIGAFCPAFGLLPYSNNGVLENGVFTNDTMTLPDAYMQNTFLMIVAGKNDSIVRDEPAKYDQALVKSNVPHIYREVSSGHGDPAIGYGFYNFMHYAFKSVK